ncbi:hypothetical protein LC082_05535 [Microbacterium esteraromaticum]|uniref:hypothetical protein n=1 Tax=Microbacterium esteraromaticum TaxID=57043 RepID=UPI001CD5D6CC|nr:hypothetical protein [Microbacterium esteraromaticum]MCA1306358.1 hypothetical protein [Microbacterium esteraromaticum]
MKSALLTTAVTPLERAVLLDMAVAVDDAAPVYSWGHDRLALAIGKTPGTAAAKQALSVHILPSLISKGLIRKTSDAHRGHRSVYELPVLDAPGMGNGSEPEWVTVSDGMGNGLSVTPLPTSLPTTPPVADDAVVIAEIDDFDRVWSVWPKKASKKTARAKFTAAAKRHPRGAVGLAEDAAVHAHAYVQHAHPVQYVPMLSTWLNGDRWDDPLPGPRGRTSGVEQNANVLARYAGGDE